MTVDGELKVTSEITAEYPLTDVKNEKNRPVIKRKGSAYKAENKSRLPGLNHNRASAVINPEDDICSGEAGGVVTRCVLLLIIKYQINASEGIVCISNLYDSAVKLKSDGNAASPVIKAADPEKKRRIYRIKASIHIPITLFLYYNE